MKAYWYKGLLRFTSHYQYIDPVDYKISVLYREEGEDKGIKKSVAFDFVVGRYTYRVAGDIKESSDYAGYLHYERTAFRGIDVRTVSKSDIAVTEFVRTDKMLTLKAVWVEDGIEWPMEFVGAFDRQVDYDESSE